MTDDAIARAIAEAGVSICLCDLHAGERAPILAAWRLGYQRGIDDCLQVAARTRLAGHWVETAP